MRCIDYIALEMELERERKENEMINTMYNQDMFFNSLTSTQLDELQAMYPYHSLGQLQSNYSILDLKNNSSLCKMFGYTYTEIA